MAGDEDYRQTGVLRVQLFEQLQTVDSRHADVADHHARPVHRLVDVQLARIGQGRHLEAGEIQRLAERLAQMRVIVDQQHLGFRGEGCGWAHARVSSWGVGDTPGTPGNRCNCTRAPPSG
ncbi:hypothetical protein D9M73_176230 [compost metagenome]